jgi:anaerobic selenocysteine-containing dehydrogenase
VRVSWDEALGDIASRWQAIAAESGAEAILPYSSAGVQGLIQMGSLDRRLFGSMGCSGLDRNICGAVAAAGLSSTIGCGTASIRNSRSQPVHRAVRTNTDRHHLRFWPLVREAQRRGANRGGGSVRTAPRKPTGACRSSRSDAALALAMMP